MYCILFLFAKNVCLCYRQLSYILQSCYKTAAEEVCIRKAITGFYKGIFLQGVYIMNSFLTLADESEKDGFIKYTDIKRAMRLFSRKAFPLLSPSDI